MSLFNIGLSGLNTAQNALTTAGHNVSNAATPGYTRQNTIIATAGGQYTSQGFFGQGSNTTTVIRVYDEFLSGQLRNAQTASAQLSSYSDQISQIDNLLADQKGGVAPLMQKFFASVQGVSDTPSDPAARQNMLNAAQTLAGQMRSANDYFRQQQEGINGSLQSSVTQINAYTKQLANLNTEIAKATAASGGQPPNDLLDQRDELVSQLNQQIGVKVVVQDKGTYNLFVGNGQPIVVGGQSYDLKAVNSAAEPTRTSIAYTLPNGTAIEMDDSAIKGGTVGGLLQFRSQTLDAAQNAIGRLSLAIGQTFNDQHKLGVDMNGAVGGNLFAMGAPKVFDNAANSATTAGSVTAAVSNVGALTTSDYTLSYDGTNYNVVRQSDNTTVYSQPEAGTTYPATITVDGVDLTLGMKLVQGDSFEVQPTRNVAASFDVAITDPAKIAAASPAIAQAGKTNTGGGTVAVSNVAQGFGTTLLPITATYNAATGKYALTDSTGAAVVNDSGGNPITPVVSGATTQYTIDGVTMTLGGTPKDGDTFTLSVNSGGVSSNGNALALAKLQNTKTIGGVSNYNDAYAQLVNDVGSRAKSISIASTSQDSITTQVRTAQQSVSGVNMDEETVSLLRYQQLYQASAKVIQTASSMFDAIIGLQ